MDYHSKKSSSHDPSPKHDYIFSFLMAALPQLIPGGGIMADYVKSMPTTYMYKLNHTSWATPAEGYTANFSHQAAFANALWIGGQALTVDILLGSFNELANILPYFRAFVTGSANQYYNDPYSSMKAFWEK